MLKLYNLLSINIKLLKNRKWMPELILFILVLSVKVLLFYSKGVSVGSDSHWYINAAKLSVNEGLIQYIQA